MKKETVIAITLGILLGVIVAVVLVLKTRQAQIQNSNPITTTLGVSPTPIISSYTVDVLEITSPEDGTIVNKNSVTITGKVAKDSVVIIESPVKQVVIKNSPETLNVDFPLAFGENVIKITAYPKDSHVSAKEKDLQVYYLDEQ
jgi:hypothetical protein